MYRMRIKGLKAKNRRSETERKKVGEKGKYVQNKNNREEKSREGRVTIKYGVMRLHEMSLEEKKA